MPIRKTPLVTNQIYHLVNRGIAKQPIFLSKKHYTRALQTVQYYTFQQPKVKLSRYLVFSREEKRTLLNDLMQHQNGTLVELLSFVLMPNHLHLLVKQTADTGISKFMSDMQNSYTRYLNTTLERTGPILQGQFKAVRIESDEQLLHVSRYIHLNPYTSYVVKTLKELENYPWSSLPEYLKQPEHPLCNTTPILSFFDNGEDYKKFILDQADYQRNLERVKHLALEDEPLIPEVS